MECELSLALVKSMKRGWPPNAIESFLFQKRIDILVVLKQLAAHHGHLVIQMRRKQLCISCVNASLSALYLISISSSNFDSFRVSEEPPSKNAHRVSVQVLFKRLPSRAYASQRLATALKDCSGDCTRPVMMLFTPVSIVLRSGTGSESTEVEVICKLNVEDAPLLKAAHGETAQASIKMSIMGETMRGYMKALGIGSLTAPGEIQLDFHPIHGCLIQSGTLIPGTEDFSKSYYLYHMCMKLLEGAQREL